MHDFLYLNCQWSFWYIQVCSFFLFFAGGLTTVQLAIQTQRLLLQSESVLPQWVIGQVRCHHCHIHKLPKSQRSSKVHRQKGLWWKERLIPMAQMHTTTQSSCTQVTLYHPPWVHNTALCRVKRGRGLVWRAEAQKNYLIASHWLISHFDHFVTFCKEVSSILHARFFHSLCIMQASFVGWWAFQQLFSE